MMKEYSRITTLKALAQARRENVKACREAYIRASGHASALADSLSPKRVLSEMISCISPLKVICSLFRKLL